MENYNRKSGEVEGTTHLIILTAYTVAALIMVVETLVMGWEKPLVPISFLMILYAWYLNLMQKYSGVQRVTLYAVFLMFNYFIYGIHTKELGILALAIIVIMLVFSTTKLRSLIWMAAATYAFTVLYDLMSAAGNFVETYGVSELHLLYQFIMVCAVVFLTHVITVGNEDRQTELLDRMQALQEKCDMAEAHSGIVAKELGKLNRISSGELLLLKQTLQEKGADEEILEKVNRIGSLQFLRDGKIAELEDYALMSSGKTRIQPESYEIQDLVAQLRQQTRHLLRENSLHLLLYLDPLCPKVLYGDREKILKILMALIINGFRYTREGGVFVRIFTRSYGDQCNLCLEVSDTGIGINQKDLEYLQEQLENRSTTEYRPGGLGLGLYLTAGFVRAMDGFFQIESEWGRGTRVSVSIPQRVADAVPCMSFDRKAGVCLAFEDRFGVYPELDEFYERFFGSFSRKVEVPAYYVKTMEDLGKLTSSYRKVCLILERSSYEEDPEFFESLTDLYLVVTSLKPMELPEGSHAHLMTAPFGTPDFLHILEDAKKSIRYRRRNDDAAEDESEEAQASSVETFEERDIRLHGGRKYMIVTDSMADLPAELSKERGIPVIPFRIFAERGAFLDGLEISQDTALSYFNKNHNMHSMAPDEEEFRTFFEDNLRYAEHLIYVSTAKRVSVAYDRAVKVAGEMDHVTVFNSGQVSGGTALMALMADEQIRQGKDLKEILEYLEKLRPRVRTSFLIDNLDHLAYVGRVSKGVGLVAKTFLLHPVMVMRHDAMKVGAVRLGNINNAKEYYLRRILHRKKEIDLSHVFVGSVGVPQKELLGLEHRLSSEGEFQHVIMKKASAAISINCGVGTFGIIYIKNGGEIG